MLLRGKNRCMFCGFTTLQTWNDFGQMINMEGMKICRYMSIYRKVLLENLHRRTEENHENLCHYDRNLTPRPLIFERGVLASIFICIRILRIITL
jgi:hypothetical protein